ncbi:MAG TPA: response regulator [Streptosporangiaceae bacterium]|nr:response regulator [Streptosporangiaceae bacterium]
MIRTVVVDDDYRVASIHAAYVSRVEGFEVIAQVHTAAAAVEAVDELKPELLLLDLYLPDEHGLDLAARLRQDNHPPVDVIVITAAKDADSVRAAMQHGALHYLLKPFSFPALRDKLLSYAQMRARLDTLRVSDQRGVDRVYGALRATNQLAGSKGTSDYTLDTVERLLAESDQDLSAAEVAKRAGMSRATAQRYLSHLHDLGRVTVRLRYGASGRPEHGYRWAPGGE